MLEALLLFGVLFFAVGVVVYKKLSRIAEDLLLAEFDLEQTDLRATGHLGRRQRVDERADWNARLNSGFSLFGRNDVALTLINTNEDELQQTGKANEKAATTACLLLQLLRGDVRSAQKIIEARSQGGKIEPYIAPGIRHLVGYRHFASGVFPAGTGESEVLLRFAVWLWHFPRRYDEARLEDIARRPW